MDRTGGHPSGQLCAIVWRSTMGFYSKSFRFEGGGRKIIGLNRTGKGCRLRWVNYLHPGLKRGKMSPQEERMVLELHAKWGNRWSRIARKLPGRTDNEIKNYWRTHMRKKAQERKRATSRSSSSSNCSSCSSTVTIVDSLPFSAQGNCSAPGKVSFYDTGGHDVIAPLSTKKMSELVEEYEIGYSMDDIWKDIELSEGNTIKPVCEGYSAELSNFSCLSMASDPSWEYCWNSIWNMDEEESKMINFPGDQLIYCFNGFGRDANLTG